MIVILYLIAFLHTKAQTIISKSMNGSWNSPSTWVGNIVPSNTNDVIIATGATIYIANDSIGNCKNISFQDATAKLAIGSNSILNIYGNPIFSSNSNMSSWGGTGKIVFTGVANQVWTIQGGSRFINIEINKSSGTVTLNNSTLSLENTLNVISGSFIMNASNVQGVGYTDGVTKKYPKITIGTGASMTISGISNIRSGITGTDPIGSVTVSGSFSLNNIEGNQNYGDVIVNTNAYVNIIGDWKNTGSYNFNSITVDSAGYYILSAINPATSSHGNIPSFFNGSFVVISSSSTNLPFSATSYGNLTLYNVVKTLVNCIINNTLSIVDSPNITTTPTYGPNAILEYAGMVQKNTGAELPTTISKLKISNTGGVVLGKTIAVDTLVFDSKNNNNLILNDKNLVVGTITGTDANSHILTNSTGYVSKSLSNSANFTFPVSSSTTSYNPVTITNSSGSDEIYNVRVINNIVPNFVAPNDTSYIVKKTWFISENTVGGNSANLTFEWNANEEGTNFPRTNASLWQNNTTTMSWEEKGVVTTVGSGPYNCTINNVSTFSPTTSTGGFIIGRAGTLPVKATIAVTENDYNLSAYPVPANPKATISFALKTKEMAIIKIYDVLGKEIAILYNEVAKANTQYYVEFDGSKFSTGTYFYTLQTPTRKEFKKLMLVK